MHLKCHPVVFKFTSLTQDTDISINITESSFVQLYLVHFGDIIIELLADHQYCIEMSIHLSSTELITWDTNEEGYRQLNEECEMNHPSWPNFWLSCLLV